MTTTFSEVLEKLRSLYELDTSIRRLDREIEEGPARLAGLRGQMDAIDGRKKALADRALLLRAQIRLRENELKATEQKIERVKTQAAEVKTNKEFVAYRAELSNYQADSDRLQGEVLKILDVVDQADAKIGQLDEERAVVQAKVDEAMKVLDESLADVKLQREALAAQRPERRKGIPPEALQAYERTHATRGEGLALLDGEYCSACMERLTRNDAYAVQNEARLVICRSCSRVLINEL